MAEFFPIPAKNAVLKITFLGSFSDVLDLNTVGIELVPNSVVSKSVRVIIHILTFRSVQPTCSLTISASPREFAGNLGACEGE